MTNCTVTTGGRSCLPMADFGGHWLFGWQHTDARRTCRETVIARVNLLLHTKHCPVGRNDAIQPRRNVGLRLKARQWSSPDGTRPLVLVPIGQHHLFRRWEEGAARSETAGELVGNLASMQEPTAGPRSTRCLAGYLMSSVYLSSKQLFLRIRRHSGLVLFDFSFLVM